MTTQDSLRSTQSALLESNMEIEKLHQELQRSYIPSYTSVIPSHMVDFIIGSKEGPHVMLEHEEYVEKEKYKDSEEKDRLKLRRLECL